MILALDIQSRDAKEAADSIRGRGLVPAVLYGPKEPSTPIAVDEKKLSNIWKEAGETTVIVLKGSGAEKETLIHDVQRHPVTGKLLHADFYVLEKGKKVEINIPLTFEGVAPAEKAGHIIVKALYEIEIEVAPAELPHELVVDLGKLAEVGDHITASEIALPPSAELKTNPEEIVASVTEFKEEPEEVAPAPETAIIGEEEQKEGAPEGEVESTEEKKEE